MSKMPAPSEIPYAVVVETKTPHEILNDFGQAMVDTFGVIDGLNTLQFLTQLLKENPVMMRKLLKVDRWQKFVELVQEREHERGGSEGFDVRDLAYLGRFKAIFKDLI